ncbi:cell division control protein 6 homolog [Asterias rubens]|uniref:cell division control protein 6 homolog n=1 Tax=Asterias rubens TaxID=7604 RepID=UPI001455B1DF|nr:cell division control protein 6 homolog [Asterias rubens]
MPVATRRQTVQTPINFRCRKTRNSTKSMKTSSSPIDGKALNDTHWKNKDAEGVKELVHGLTTPEKCVSQSTKRKERRLCKSVPAKCVGTSSLMTSASSPRKRILLKEMTSNDHHPVTSPCSPRKMKKENVPIKTELTGDDPSQFQPSAKARLTPKINRIRMSALDSADNTTTSPQKTRVSLGISPTKRSPIKAVASLKLERAQGDCYKNTKQALHTTLPDRLLCRDKELNTITSFLKTHLTLEKPGSLYISGAPGTGKTACLSQVLKKQQKLTSKAKVVFVNCMSVRQSQGIYTKILTEVTGRDQGKLSAKEAARKLQKLLTTSGPMVVLVLDEIDHLDSKGQEVLYTMFEWPSLAMSRLILIGIANALDLTDRILPRLQARPKCRPELLHFCPYSKDQIATILVDRVNHGCENGSVVEPVALQLCARKVAAVAGDIRKALDVCRRAVEIVECDVKSQLLFSSRSPVKSHGVETNLPTVKKVGIKQVSSVISEVYGSRLVTSASQAPTFPLQQKLMICTVLLMVRGGRLKEITLGKCHEKYSKLCRDRQMPAVEQSEFLSLCQLVESRGLIGLKTSKETRQSKICLKLNEKEVEQALQDKVLLSSILQSHISKNK